MGKVYLVLDSGECFEGTGFGAEGEALGEVVFTTGMTGYLETLTDRSYYGQMVVQTFPLIGNYGVIPEDFESDAIGPLAYIVRDLCDEPSNFRSQGKLGDYLKERNIIGIMGVDTRRITRVIRESGVMNGQIVTDLSHVDRERIHSYCIEGAVLAMSTKVPYVVEDEQSKKHVVLWDFGLKKNIIRELVARGCKVTVVPAQSTAKEILALSPDGIMLSNGPGDPMENKAIIEELAKLAKSNVPMFGICLGHQLLALAHGFATTKLKYGHRGANQPVKDLITGQIYISSQNHGYAVVTESIDRQVATPWFHNVNDKTNEGIWYTRTNACSVQFHPEACGGPLDAGVLFDRFLERMEG